MCPALQRGRRGEADACSLTKSRIRRNSRSPANNCSRWFITPNARIAGAANCSRISARNFPPMTAARATTAFRRAPPSTARWPRRNFSPASIASARRSGFGVGLNHVVEVLTGADTEKIRKWEHDTAFHLRHRQGTQPPGMGGHRARTDPARLAAADDGEIQRAGNDERRPRRAQGTQEDHAHQTRRRAGDESRITSAKSPATKCCSSACANCARRSPTNATCRPTSFSPTWRCGRWRGIIPRANATSRASAAWAKRNCASSATFFSAKSPRICRRMPRQIFADDSFAAPPVRKSSLNDTARETLRRFRAGESVEQIAANADAGRQHHLRPSGHGD